MSYRRMEEDSLAQPDRRTAKLVRQVASDVFGCLKFTSDCPSSNQDGKMQVLDLSVWLEKSEDGSNRI